MRQIDSKIEQVVNLAAFGRHRSRLLFGTWTEHVTLQEREKNQRWSSPAVVMCIILATKRSVFSLRTTKRWLHSKPSTNWELDIVSTSSTWIHVGDSHGFSISIYWYIYIHIYTHIYIYIYIYCWSTQVVDFCTDQTLQHLCRQTYVYLVYSNGGKPLAGCSDTQERACAQSRSKLYSWGSLDDDHVGFVDCWQDMFVSEWGTPKYITPISLSHTYIYIEYL